MFWKFALESSGLDTLLAKEDVTLLELLDEEDVLQECKIPNDKLLDFITQNDNVKELLHLVIDTPNDDVDDSLKYKYMNIACEIIILDVDALLEKIACDVENLDIIWSFLDNPSPLNPLMASFFSKVLTMLICRKSQQTFDYLKSHDAVNRLIVHIDISAIMELFIKIVTVVEQSEIRMDICNWLVEEKLVEKLIDYLHPSEEDTKHFYAGQLLCELVHIGRESISQFLDADENSVENPLLLTLENKEVIGSLLTVIFDGVDQPYSDSAILNGISVLSSLIEIKRPTIEGMEELIPVDIERIAQGCHTALEVLSSKLQDFHNVLVKPQSMVAMETTFGVLDPPLGKVRLAVAGLIASAIATSSLIINDTLAKTGTMDVLLSLFSRYEWNNFLHSHVAQCIGAILCSEAPSDMDAPSDNDAELETIETGLSVNLVQNLFQDCNLIQRCLDLWEANEISERSGNGRRGYMGHLTRIVNTVNNAKEKGPNTETVQSMFNNLTDHTRQQWNELCEGSLEEINKKNVCTSMKSWFSQMDSNSEDDDYRTTTLSNYEGTMQQLPMQQAFENYQVKPMSNEFIESFGYDVNSLYENENIKNPFDDVGKIDFTINANEESENEKIYNSICEQKIRPFDDSSSDEEDMWEEKELTFSSNPAQPRESAGSHCIGSDSESSSDEEKDLKEDGPNSPDAIASMQSDGFTENVDMDSEWTANFNSFGVSTENNTTAEWPSTKHAVDSTTPFSTSEGFANFDAMPSSDDNFANFADFDNICATRTDSLQMETETESPEHPHNNEHHQQGAGSPYEVTMEGATTGIEMTCLDDNAGAKNEYEIIEMTTTSTTTTSSPGLVTSTTGATATSEALCVDSISVHVVDPEHSSEDTTQQQLTDKKNLNAGGVQENAHNMAESNKDMAPIMYR